MPKAKVTRYIILPARGLTTTAAAQGHDFLVSLNASVGNMASPAFTLAAPKAPKIKILDSIHENGAKLVELPEDQVSLLRTSEPGVRIVPEVFYEPAVAPRQHVESKVTTAAGTPALKIEITVRSKATGSPVKGVRVIAFTDFAGGTGAEATTNAAGKAGLALGGGSRLLDRIYLYPNSGFWPMMKKNLTINNSSVIQMSDIDLSFTDCVRHFYGKPALTVGNGVKVGVIDSGVANHPDLAIDGGRNTVTGELPTNFGDNGMEGHGTHVAGIVAARGTAPTGVRGIAPGVTLRSYRVFGQGQKGASNFSIAKAIDAAVTDKCDLINMSLRGDDEDPLTTDAIAAARAAGTVVLAANGNDGRLPVSFPAAVDLCLAVSAMGRKGTFPSGTDITPASPFGTDPLDFVADFSNIGADTDLTGPGVGVISTVPGGYAIMSGTSMACPATAGALARRLAQNAAILAMPRDLARSNAIIALFGSIVAARGFGPLFEGRGMIKP